MMDAVGNFKALARAHNYNPLWLSVD